MKISHPSLRTIVLAGSLVLAPTTVVILAQESCPPIIASLFPKNASSLSGQYYAGETGLGNGSADLSLEDSVCIETVYSARIKVAIRYFGGEAAILIKSDESPFGPIDRDADKEQFITDATNELAQNYGVMSVPVTAPARETLGIGEIVYVEYKSECPRQGPVAQMADIGPLIVPNVTLRGVAWTDNAKLEVTLEGSANVELAKAAVAEVFANFEKADFSKAK